jgi:hypothetical protein
VVRIAFSTLTAIIPRSPVRLRRCQTILLLILLIAMIFHVAHFFIVIVIVVFVLKVAFVVDSNVGRPPTAAVFITRILPF